MQRTVWEILVIIEVWLDPTNKKFRIIPKDFRKQSLSCVNWNHSPKSMIIKSRRQLSILRPWKTIKLTNLHLIFFLRELLSKSMKYQNIHKSIEIWFMVAKIILRSIFHCLIRGKLMKLLIMSRQMSRLNGQSRSMAMQKMNIIPRESCKMTANQTYLD